MVFLLFRCLRNHSSSDNHPLDFINFQKSLTFPYTLMGIRCIPSLGLPCPAGSPFPPLPLPCPPSSPPPFPWPSLSPPLAAPPLRPRQSYRHRPPQVTPSTALPTPPCTPHLPRPPPHSLKSCSPAQVRPIGGESMGMLVLLARGCEITVACLGRPSPGPLAPSPPPRCHGGFTSHSPRRTRQLPQIVSSRSKSWPENGDGSRWVRSARASCQEPRAE